MNQDYSMGISTEKKNSFRQHAFADPMDDRLLWGTLGKTGKRLNRSPLIHTFAA